MNRVDRFRASPAWRDRVQDLRPSFPGLSEVELEALLWAFSLVLARDRNRAGQSPADRLKAFQGDVDAIEQAATTPKVRA